MEVRAWLLQEKKGTNLREVKNHRQSTAPNALKKKKGNVSDGGESGERAEVGRGEAGTAERRKGERIDRPIATLQETKQERCNCDDHRCQDQRRSAARGGIFKKRTSTRVCLPGSSMRER